MALQILRYIERYIDKDDEIVEDFRLLFAEDLNPVAPKAQRKVYYCVHIVFVLVCYIYVFNIEH